MAISFSGTAKAELCRCFPQKHCCDVAQAFGVLLYCNSFGVGGLRIITESRDFAMLLPKLFRKAFDLDFDVFPDRDIPGKQLFQITDPKKLSKIMSVYGFDTQETLSLHLNLPVVENECCRSAFLRGAFLAGGSVTAPEKGYHLELNTTHQSVARETYTLIEEILGFYPKSTDRSGGCILYLKQSDRICDFLTCMGAPVAAMEIMEAKLEKELNNKVNRRCNCDDANTSKVVEAAQEQLAAIRILESAGMLDNLPAKLRGAAVARMANPEASLTELAAMMVPPISKPAMNNRLKRLILAAKEVKT